MQRGEIWWARIPMSGSRGKRRPMLIVSDDTFNRNERYPKVMVVHITTVRRLGGPYDWEVEIPRGTAGLDRTSLVKGGEVYTLWKDQLQSLLGTLPRSIMHQVDKALAISLSLYDLL
jgi:mRNA interferase MazF